VGIYVAEVRCVERRTVAGPSSTVAVRVERRPLHRLVAGAACPGGVAAAGAKARLDPPAPRRVRGCARWGSGQVGE